MAKTRIIKKAVEINPVAPFLTEELTPNDDPAAILSAEEIIAYTHFTRAVVTEINRPYLTFRNCIFSGGFFIDCKFKSAQISDVRFENCDLSNVSFSGSAIHRTEFISCKLVGTNFGETTLGNVLMSDCNGHYINLSMAKMEQVKFQGCDFKGGSLHSNRFNGVAFEHCTLVESDFSHTSLKGINLSNSRIEGIQINIPDLKGARISTLQAMDLVSLLGIIIEE